MESFEEGSEVGDRSHMPAILWRRSGQLIFLGKYKLTLFHGIYAQVSSRVLW